MIAQLLTICYLAGLTAAMLKATRYWLDYQRRGQHFYLVGVPANLALALTLALLVISTGDDPAIPLPTLRTLIRASLMVWAGLGLLFEVLYIASFLELKKDDYRVD
jgi:hypothetical protein